MAIKRGTTGKKNTQSVKKTTRSSNHQQPSKTVESPPNHQERLDWTDRMILETMINNFNGGPVGLESVAASTGEDAKTIEDVYEPYLLQIGFLHRTHRGRMVTELAREHLLKGVIAQQNQGVIG